MKEFREVYEKEGSHNLQSQIKYLAALADFYHEKGSMTGDWVPLIKVRWKKIQFFSGLLSIVATKLV